MTEVLYLSYDGMTDPLGQSQVLPYITGLTAKGYSFHLVSFEKQEAFSRGKVIIEEQLKGYPVTWYPLSYTKSPPVISTVYDYWRMYRLAAKITRKHKIKIIHCRSYISALAGRLLQSKDVKFLFDMRGFWADERVEGGLWNLSNPLYKIIYRFFKKKERQMLAFADGVVSLTENAKAEIESWNVRDKPVHVIPCCADLELFSRHGINEEEKSSLLKELGIPPGTPVITYLGAIGTWYLLDEMLQFYKMLLSKRPGTFMLFITTENPSAILKQAEILGVETGNIRFYKSPRKMVPVALSLGEVSLFFIRDTYSKKASSPTKQGEIMGMGIPVICNSGVGDTDNIILKYRSGFLVKAGSNDSYLEAINNYDNIRSIDPEIIRKGAETFYSLDNGIEKYAALYLEMLHNHE